MTTRKKDFQVVLHAENHEDFLSQLAVKDPSLYAVYVRGRTQQLDAEHVARKRRMEAGNAESK